MYNFEDMVARMLNGETPDVIAKEMTEALNKAKKEVDVQKKKEAEEAAAKAKADKIAIQKRDELDEIVGYFNDWVETYYGKDKICGLTADSVIKYLDSIDKLTVAIADMADRFSKKAEPIKKKVVSSDPFTVIADFLNNMGW